MIVSDVPCCGFYTIRLVKRGVAVPVRIYFGPAIIDGEVQDRAPDYHVLINGRSTRTERDDGGYRCRVPFSIDQVWPFCARTPIDAAEYRYLLRDAAWARAHAPDHPRANPRKPIDVRSIKAAF